MPDQMNDVRSFRALHYDPKKVGDIGLCLSQPDDVISPAQQDAYYRQHPHNVVRLILNKIDPADGESNNRYTRARDYADGRILPHEKVLKGPLEDRIRLTQVTHTQFEYIWSLYKDRTCVIDDILDQQERQEPIVDYMEKPLGVRYKLWRLTDPAQCDIIRRAVSRMRIYIADRHHRYQTMLTIRDQMRKRFPAAGPYAPWEHIMMFLVNSEHEGLTILPTHRMLHGIKVASIKGLGAAILEHFHVKKCSFRDGDEGEAKRRWLRDLRDVHPGEHKFGAYIQNTNGYYLAALRILGITEEQLSVATNIGSTKDVDEALARVREGNMQVALILNPTALAGVITIAENGEKMPRKSTHFYPKLVSGLPFYPMTPGSTRRTARRVTTRPGVGG